LAEYKGIFKDNNIPKIGILPLMDWFSILSLFWLSPVVQWCEGVKKKIGEREKTALLSLRLAG